MRALVFVEHWGEELHRGALGVLTRAASLDGEVGAVIAGRGPLEGLAAEAGQFGAARVWTAADDRLA